MAVGTHVLGELYGCPPELLRRVESVRPLMENIAQQANFRVVGEKFHQFEPEGVTGVMVLAESHFSVHTWPEKGLVAADVFTCGEEGNAEKAFDLLCQHLKPQQVTKRVITR